MKNNKRKSDKELLEEIRAEGEAFMKEEFDDMLRQNGCPQYDYIKRTYNKFVLKFGKYKGQKLKDTPKSYRKWLFKQPFFINFSKWTKGIADYQNFKHNW